MSLLADLDRENAFNGRQIGRYRLGGELGHGAFGRVYFATDTDLDREVALKFLRPVDGKYSDKLKARFEREAKLVSKLKGQHTITLFDYGELDDLVFLAFEYIEGQTIQEMLEEATHALHSLRVAKILEQSLKGIAEAHHYGILHRDIKPANIMIFEHIGVPDQIKVMDFGIGKNLYDDEALNTLTNDNAMLGTPLYMSPEHLKSDLELTTRSDLYSLGMVAYEMLTGASPYQNMSPFKIFTEIAMGPDIQLSSTERIPGGLSRVINKMLRKDADERYATAHEALADLVHLKPQPTSQDPPNALYDSGDVSSGVHPGADLIAHEPSTAEVAFFDEAPREETLGLGEVDIHGAQINAERTRLAIAALVITSLCAVGLLAVLFSGPSDAKDTTLDPPADTASDTPATSQAATQAVAATPPPEDLPRDDLPAVTTNAQDAGAQDASAIDAGARDTAPEADEPAEEHPAVAATAPAPKPRKPRARKKPRVDEKPEQTEAEAVVSAPAPDPTPPKIEPRPDPIPEPAPETKTEPKPRNTGSILIPDD